MTMKPNNDTLIVRLFADIPVCLVEQHAWYKHVDHAGTDVVEFTYLGQSDPSRRDRTCQDAVLTTPPYSHVEFKLTTTRARSVNQGHRFLYAYIRELWNHGCFTAYLPVSSSFSWPNRASEATGEPPRTPPERPEDPAPSTANGRAYLSTA